MIKRIINLLCLSDFNSWRDDESVSCRSSVTRHHELWLVKWRLFRYKFNVQFSFISPQSNKTIKVPSRIINNSYGDALLDKSMNGNQFFCNSDAPSSLSFTSRRSHFQQFVIQFMQFSEKKIILFIFPACDFLTANQALSDCLEGCLRSIGQWFFRLV